MYSEISGLPLFLSRTLEEEMPWWKKNLISGNLIREVYCLSDGRERHGWHDLIFLVVWWNRNSPRKSECLSRRIVDWIVTRELARFWWTLLLTVNEGILLWPCGEGWWIFVALMWFTFQASNQRAIGKIDETDHRSFPRTRLAFFSIFETDLFSQRQKRSEKRYLPTWPNLTSRGQFVSKTNNFENIDFF